MDDIVKTDENSFNKSKEFLFQPTLVSHSREYSVQNYTPTGHDSPFLSFTFSENTG
jgi:hypothetical protein